MSKVKIILDADVLIHFTKSEYFHQLASIYPGYQLAIIDELYKVEIKGEVRNYVDKYRTVFAGSIEMLEWKPDYEMLKDFSELHARMGYGESMCLAYCKHHHEVIASSNITEITGYCETNGIQYITTLDFLYEAFVKKIMTEEECNEFIQNVIAKGSKLPDIKITQYTARQIYM
jgi:hypothetical protein